MNELHYASQGGLRFQKIPAFNLHMSGLQTDTTMPILGLNLQLFPFLLFKEYSSQQLLYFMNFKFSFPLIGTIIFSCGLLPSSNGNYSKIITVVQLKTGSS